MSLCFLPPVTSPSTSWLSAPLTKRQRRFTCLEGLRILTWPLFLISAGWGGSQTLWVTRGSPCVELAECRWQEEQPALSGNLGTSQAVEA